METSKMTLLNCHAKAPKTEADVHQCGNFILTANPDIFVGDFNFDAKKNESEFDKIATFTNMLSKYNIPALGGITSVDNQKMVGPVSTTRKQRGFESIQWNKIGVIVESRKDFHGFNKEKYTVQGSLSFPDLSELNSDTWPADHQCIATIVSEKISGLRSIVLSLNKVEVWKAGEWMGNEDIQLFGYNNKYFPPSSDRVFKEIIKRVYPNMSWNEPNWYSLINAYNSDNELGMSSNTSVSDWSKPDDRLCNKFTYPTVSFNDDEPYYHTWNFKDFAIFLKVDELNLNRYTVLDFQTWSEKWFDVTGYHNPIEGGGTVMEPWGDSSENNTYNDKFCFWQTINDSGVNLGLRLFQYQMTWFTLYKLEQQLSIVMSDIELTDMYTSYETAFKEIYGTIIDNKPYGNFPIKFNTDKHNDIIYKRIMHELDKLSFMDCETIYINIQEDWRFNDYIKSMLLKKRTIARKFNINYLWKKCPDKTINDIDVSILVMSVKKVNYKERIVPITFSEKYTLSEIDGETVKNGKRVIESILKKNLIIEVSEDTNPHIYWYMYIYYGLYYILNICKFCLNLTRKERRECPNRK